MTSQLPQALPVRGVDLVTDEADALAAAQPERGRRYIRIRPGRFAGEVAERSDGIVAIARERWNAPLRVHCARPCGYVAFSVVVCDEAATWCGIPLGPRSVLQLDCDWEVTTRGGLEACSLAVERDALERTEASLFRGEEPPPLENRVLDLDAQATERLRRRVVNLLRPGLPHGARAALQADLVHLATRLRRRTRPETWSLASSSSRRAAVRRVEEFLEAHECELPSLAELCGVAGVSERTLGSAFREQLGLTPSRYLRLRRLNHVRRELLAADPRATQLADVATRWGFWQLGRFASEYLAMFGEHPSETLGLAARSA